jgi:predicted DNA-binding protein (UPF0251 family)
LDDQRAGGVHGQGFGGGTLGTGVPQDLTAVQRAPAVAASAPIPSGSSSTGVVQRAEQGGGWYNPEDYYDEPSHPWGEPSGGQATYPAEGSSHATYQDDDSSQYIDPQHLVVGPQHVETVPGRRRATDEQVMEAARRMTAERLTLEQAAASIGLKKQTLAGRIRKLKKKGMIPETDGVGPGKGSATRIASNAEVIEAARRMREENWSREDAAKSIGLSSPGFGERVTALRKSGQIPPSKYTHK